MGNSSIASLGTRRWVRELHFVADGNTLISTDFGSVAWSWNLKSGCGSPANAIHAPAAPRYAWS